MCSSLWFRHILPQCNIRGIYNCMLGRLRDSVTLVGRYLRISCEMFLIVCKCTSIRGLRWPSGLERWRPGGRGRVRIPMRQLCFGTFAIPFTPLCHRGGTKSRWSLLSDVYARGSKISHQSALECVTVVDSTTHATPPPLWH